MRTIKGMLRTSLLAGTALLSTAGLAHAAADSVTLTASRQSTLLPDGNSVPMWGWTCGAATGAICTATNGVAQTGGTIWQPPLITVPMGDSLTITVNNSLPVPTSLVIVGQLPSGDTNGLGNPTRETGRPAHPTQTATTWTTVVTNQPAFTPPGQAARARSFVAEAGAGPATGCTTPATCSVTYTWSSLKPGTYLIETGTYPSIQAPMGLYGVLVVTQAPATVSGTFMPGMAYPSVGPIAGSIPANPAPGVTYDADGVLLLSEIDSVQNVAADYAAAAGADPFMKWTPACASTNSCYPPAVDYSPTYYLVNGQGFDRTNPGLSALNIGSTYSTGRVLLRFVNAGLRMHVPSVVGLPMSMVAEDGNVAPDEMLALRQPAGSTPPGPKTQSDWFMAAGKVYDIMVQPAQGVTTAGPTGTFATAAFPMFDRQLSLSNNNERDGGMQNLIAINGGTANSVAGIAGFSNFPAFAAAVGAQAAAVVADNFIVPAGATTFSANVLLNDVGVHSAQPVCGPVPTTDQPITAVATTGNFAGTLSPNGSFTLTAIPATFTNGATATFNYCGNGTLGPAQVTLTAATVGNAPMTQADNYTSNVSTLLAVAAPGVLANDSDTDGYPLKAQPYAGGAAMQAGKPIATSCAGVNVTLFSNGSFTATAPYSTTGTGPCTFQYVAVNSQGTASSVSAPTTVTLNFLGASNVPSWVTVKDALTSAGITDYKWVIEQDRTFLIDPNCQQNGPGGVKLAGCPTGTVPTLATNFHTSFMPVVAGGCTGAQSCERGQSVYDPASKTHLPAICENNICVPSGALANPSSSPWDVNLPAFLADGVTPARYYISILPGDAGNAANTGNAGSPNPSGGSDCLSTQSSTTAPGWPVTSCGHGMTGAPIPACTTTAGTACTFAPVVMTAQRNPLQTATLSIFVFEDDAPLNGEHDIGGNGRETGLGDFQVVLWDEMGQAGDFTGQMTYDIFNLPLSNSLNGIVDPLTGQNACPVAPTASGTVPDTTGVQCTTADPTTSTYLPAGCNPNYGKTVPNQTAAGVIIVCPQYEADGVTPSPLAGTALVKNLMPGRFGVIVHPSAAREARGEEWIQTNTLDGTHFLDSFVRSGEPAYFQEFGPGGWHVFMGMANPAIINARKQGICNGGLTNGAVLACNHDVKGQVTNLHMSRAPNETLYDSSLYGAGNTQNYKAFAHTNCWVSLGDPDGDTFMFTKCDADGNFKFEKVPQGNWALVVGDQWLDLIVDGSSKPLNLNADGSCNGQPANTPCQVAVPAFSWQTHIWTSTYMDLGGLGAPVVKADGSLDPAFSPGLIQVPTRIRMRNGRFNNTSFTDASGHNAFNETFPLFSWYVVESDTTRFRSTGTHVVYDAGGQIDGPTPMGNGKTTPYGGILSSTERFSVPVNLRVPGAVYCAVNDPQCALTHFANLPNGNTATAPTTGLSTGRIDPGNVPAEGLQGFISQTQIIDFGKQPYLPGETGGIRGHVAYSSTRPFDDPGALFQNLWEPLVPGVTINLYQEGTAPDGTQKLTLVDTTTTSSWDAWAQGFRSGGTTPNMNCPGQDAKDPFFPYTLMNTTNYLSPGMLPNNSQYKCYDGLHNFNQVQPAPYDGVYLFPSPTCASNPSGTISVVRGGQPVTIHCATVANPAWNATAQTPAIVNGVPQTGAAPAVLPPGKYVAEVVLPPGYEITKEEDKNILLGDAFVGPVGITAQFSGIADIFIVPDQASIDAYNQSYTGPITGSNPYNTTGVPCTGPNMPIGCNANFGTPVGQSSQPTNAMGRSGSSTFGPGGLIVQNAPCAGALRVVPDFMTISPESGQVAPFAGALRALCDRKEITLEDQMQASADFFVWTKTPAATHFSGFILDDMSSEFDPASPTFGEKFAVPNLPIAIKDFNGVQLSRLYSDQWGLYDGMVFSTWDVNPPNPTGYSPGMEITSMNDPGPIPAPKCQMSATLNTPALPLGCTANGGEMITDPWFNPQYSNFVYENPFMPADTTYLDTPVVPVSAFAEGYNPPDCAYMDGTPAIKSVLGDAVADNASYVAAGGTALGGTGRGPWIAALGGTLTINALGDQVEPNHAYAGPAASTAPYNQKFITRHYGFCPLGMVSCAPGTVTLTNDSVIPKAVVPLNCGTGNWSDMALTCTVPAGAAIPPCRMQQYGYGTTAANTALCGELEIVTATGQRTVDTGTVTIGGKAPTYLNGEINTSSVSGNAIQTAIDAATPGDMIIVGPGTGAGASGIYNEMVLMWKPVRLQGVGAAAVTISANAHPSGPKIEAWRRQVDCLFGLAMNGAPILGDPTHQYQAGDVIIPAPIPPSPYDPSGRYTCNADPAAGPVIQGQSDPTPAEPIIGWDGQLNGNLAQLLQEPTLMGSYEGAAITVLAKGVLDPVSCSFAGAPCTRLTAGPECVPGNPNYFAGNFLCNPARIDGLTVANGSQGGGGIFVHGWNHYLEISNNRVTNNAGTLSGGITIGQAETEIAVATDAAGNVCPTCVEKQARNISVWVHHNSVTMNTAFGDELNSTTPGEAGGVSINTGSDNYRFTNNWVCGNLSSGDGGGFTHFGLSFNGEISHNAILFNQSHNPTIPTYGGGITISGAPFEGAVQENSPIDLDRAPALSPGAGPGLVIDGNLIMGNTAESGGGGGLRLQHFNGYDVFNTPTVPANWWGVTIQNNIIVNNVAGWAGGGVSIQDAVKVNFRNNTVASNDTTATAGILFDTLGAPNSTTAPPGCDPRTGVGCTNPVTNSQNEPAGLVVHPHSLMLSEAFATAGTTPVPCPAGSVPPGASHAQDCKLFSHPILANNIFFQNRAFHITVAAPPLPVIQLVPALTQATTGACPSTGQIGGAGPSYWDIGVYGDGGPTTFNPAGYRLNPTNSILTSTAGYGAGGAGNRNGTFNNPDFAGQYCNGSRPPPEIARLLCTSYANAPGCIQPGTVGVGITVPSGAPDNQPFYTDFTLVPAATVDEGNNWINMFYGPLSQVNASIRKGSAGYAVPLGNYLPLNAGAVGGVPTTVQHPALDFFGNPRPDAAFPSSFDIGAIEISSTGVALTAAPFLSWPGAPGPLAFGSLAINGTTTATATRTVTVHNPWPATAVVAPPAITGITAVTTGPWALAANPGTCAALAGVLAAPAAAGGDRTCTIVLAFQPIEQGATTGTLTVTGSVAIARSPVNLAGNGLPPVPPATLAANTTANFGTVAAGVTLAAAPQRAFNLTSQQVVNGVAVRLTGIQQPVLSGTNVADFVIVGSNCGAPRITTAGVPPLPGGAAGRTSIGPPGGGPGICTVQVRFRPVVGLASGTVLTAVLSVTEVPGTLPNPSVGGTQTVTLTGTVQ